MKKIELNKFSELEKLGEILKENKIVIDLNNCDMKERIRIIDFFAGITFLNGSLEKLSPNEFKITVNKEC